MCIISFKERVRNEAIANAHFYKEKYVEFEYLICSEAFDRGYHIVKSDEGNYLHLIGIHTELSAQMFFDKCMSGELREEDFDFKKPGKTEKDVKGSVREKIKVLPYMLDLFEKSLLAEDNFKKNKVECAFATTDNTCTLGFVSAGRPKSLLKGNELDRNKAKKVDLIFRKRRGNGNLYEELIWGNREEIEKYKGKIKNQVEEKFFEYDK